MQTAACEPEDRRGSVDGHQSLLPISEGQSSEQSDLPSRSPQKRALEKCSQLRQGPMQWKIEILSWIGSLCFFIATAVVLWVLDGRPLPDLQYGLKPNAIIGTLATFAEALLIVPVSSAIGQIKWLQALQTRPMDNFRTIDDASRGPWGSVLLLARRKGGLIASFGAVLTIMALGISTFFQQALRYETAYPHSDNASMQIAQYMNGSGFAPIGHDASISGVDTQLLAAPNIALFSPPHTKFPATAHCGTGNCTWESYQTLGICNTCEDLTATLKTTKVHFDPNNDAKTAYDTIYYTLPNGFGLTGVQPGEMINQVAFLTSHAMLNITTTWAPSSRGSVSGDWDSVAFTHNGSKLLSVFAVGASPGTIPTQTSNFKDRPFASPVAFECLLQFCIRNMRAEYTNGTLYETEVSNWTGQSQPLPNSGNNPDIILQSPTSPAVFIATGVAIDGTKSWLSSLLVGNATIGTGNSYLKTPAYSSDSIQAFYMAMNSSTTGFPDLMDNLANSLSLSLRSIQYQPSVHGKAFSAISHAVVAWQWLVLPLFELVASLVFLITVMVKTRKAGLVPWTNSVLAYFFHGLNERPRGRYVHGSQGSMEELARELLMEFQSHEDGGHLVIANP